MNPIRIFAMQSTRVPPSDMQPGATKAPTIDAAAAAAICAGMPERWYRAAMYIWGRDESYRQWLFIELWMETIAVAKREGWKTVGKKATRCGNSLTCRAIEGIEPNEHADLEAMVSQTDGVGYPYIIATIAMVELGEARFWGQPAHWMKKAVLLGVGKSAWFETWDSRVAASRQILEDWAGRGFSYAARRQRGSEHAA